MKLGAKKKQRINAAISQLSPLARAFCGYSERQPYQLVTVPKVKKKRGPPAKKLDFDQLKEMYYGGVTFESIAIKLDTSAPTVWQRVNRLIKDGKLVCRGRLLRRDAEIPEVEFIELYNAKTPYKKMANKYGVSDSTICNKAKDLIKRGILKPRYKKRVFTLGK